MTNTSIPFSPTTGGLSVKWPTTGIVWPNPGKLPGTRVKCYTITTVDSTGRVEVYPVRRVSMSNFGKHVRFARPTAKYFRSLPLSSGLSVDIVHKANLVVVDDGKIFRVIKNRYESDKIHGSIELKDLYLNHFIHKYCP